MCVPPFSAHSPTAFLAPVLPATTRPAGRPALCMSSGESDRAGSAVTRRAALAALAAAVAGAASGAGPASAGSAAKQSIFGYGGASSPYTYADQATGTVLYKVRVPRRAGGEGPLTSWSYAGGGGLLAQANLERLESQNFASVSKPAGPRWCAESCLLTWCCSPLLLEL